MWNCPFNFFVFGWGYHTSTSSGFYCHWSDFPFPQVELTDIYKSELMKQFRLLENQQPNLCEWGFVSFSWGSLRQKEKKEKESKKKKKGDAVVFALACFLSSLMTFVWWNTQLGGLIGFLRVKTWIYNCDYLLCISLCQALKSQLRKRFVYYLVLVLAIQIQRLCCCAWGKFTMRVDLSTSRRDI